MIVSGKPQKIANLFAFEAANNPHTAPPPNAPDSNPYDVQALGSHAALVVDAGGNTLLRVYRTGRVEVVAVFPDEVVPTANIKSLAGCPGSGADFCSLPPAIPAQPVPTSIAIDARATSTSASSKASRHRAASRTSGVSRRTPTGPSAV